MRPEPVLSIITVVRNNLQGVAASLRSILHQELQAVQIIVVDGASTDGTTDYIERIAGNYIDTFISEPDRGIYHAMNKGVQHARAPWIMFLNAGDTLASNDCLAKLALKDRTNSDVDLIYGQALARSTGKPMGYAAIDKLWLRMAFNHEACVIRTDVMRARPYNEQWSIVADWHFFVQCLKDGCRFEGVEIPLIVFDQTGVSARSFYLRTWQRFLIARRLFPERPVYSEFLRILWKEGVTRDLKQLWKKRS